jgi:hypothetical protein
MKKIIVFAILDGLDYFVTLQPVLKTAMNLLNRGFVRRMANVSVPLDLQVYLVK